MNGTELITAERARQVSVEGWTPEHDREHSQGEMAMAAACYASPAPIRAEMTSDVACGCRSVEECTHNVFGKKEWRDPWPWDSGSDKRGSHDRVRQLAIAGALIAAEIDRLQGTVPAAPAPHPDTLEQSWRIECSLIERDIRVMANEMVMRNADHKFIGDSRSIANKLLEMRKVAPVEAKPHPDTERFCIQNSGYVGNSIRLWRVDGGGYTSNISEAWKVSKEKADQICRTRPKEDCAIPLSILESLSEKHVDVQKLTAAGFGIDAARKASEEKPA